MSRLFVIAALLLAVTACGEAKAIKEDPAWHLYQIGGIVLGLDVVSLINSGKTLDDHFIGNATDQDCSTVRLSKGGPYCVPLPAPVAMIDVTEYCYKTLGGRATCYTQPLPSDASQYNGSRTDQIPAP
jgi:hypothetical protein